MSQNAPSPLVSWSAPIPTTIEHVKWAHEIFGSGEVLTSETMLELVSKCNDTRTLREHYMSKPSFRSRYGVLVRQLLQESIRYKRQSLRRVESDLTEMHEAIAKFSKQTDMAIREAVKVLEVFAALNKAGEDLRNVTRKERALSREVAEQKRRIEELARSLDYVVAGGVGVAKHG